MWQRLGAWVIKNRLALLIILFVTTGIMGFFASKVKLSYEFSKAIPTDNPKYVAYQAFKQRFGDDGNLLVIGIKTPQLFELNTFKAYQTLEKSLKKVSNVEDVLCIPSAINLQKDPLTEKLSSYKIFTDSIALQADLDAAKDVFLSLPFYKSLLYNADSNAYLMGVKINKDTLNSARRTIIIAQINKAVEAFSTSTQIKTHISGLPLIRTQIADRVKNEMKYFLIGSILLSALILLLFFRSISTTLLSLGVVILGVIWCVGLIHLLGYKISLLTALIPSLVVVIGVPNCIYFINKYHTNYLRYTSTTLSENAQDPSTPLRMALVDMVSKMGVVTLFCNITAAIGFAVFALTKSAILKEFGVVAGISIMIIFVISFILLPSVLSYLPAPKPAQTKYLNNKWITSFLSKTENWVLHYKKTIYIATAAVLVFSIIGLFKLKTVAYIVDDLPKTDKIYTDLKFFENNFKGVMPLEIVVDAKKPNGLRKPGVFEKIDSLSQYIVVQKGLNRPVSLAEGFKFLYQGFSGGDSLAYAFPNEAVISQGLAEIRKQLKKEDTTIKNGNVAKMFVPFIDSTMQYTRISVSMADVGTVALPTILNGIEKRTNELFDTAEHKVTLTGTSITFLEGSQFIINGLKESIFWAFLLIALCMLYLFKSVRILVCSLLPNIIPLIITAGIMGWVGVPLKPSTVLVFSVALGIAIDITIRFLVNYKQELPTYNNNVTETVKATIKHTGLSIVYTSLVLTAGFIIFCISGFGGTKALGWLTSVTLFVATLTNIVLLPTLLILFEKSKKVESQKV
jgi:predicted RND superfamily exporter protein